MRFAMRIRVARQRAGLSQQELASRLGISRGAVSNWENDSGTLPATERLQRIAVVTGVSFEWLATGRGPVRHDPDKDMVLAADAEMVEDPLELRLLRAFRAAPKREHLRIQDFAQSRAFRKPPQGTGLAESA